MDEKQAITNVFNLVATRYDNPSLRFFLFVQTNLLTTQK